MKGDIFMASKFGYTYDHYFDFSTHPYFSEMNDVFSGIFDRSVQYYFNKNDGYQQQFALRKIVEYVRDLEKSLVGLINLGYVTTENVDLIKKSFKELDTIGLLDSKFKGRIYGVTYDVSKRIEINPNLGSSKTLSSEDRTLLYVAHEMGHRFHYGWTNPRNLNFIFNEPKVYELYKKLTPQNQRYIYSGLSLLDEAVAQDRAEEIAYYFAGKQRPALTPKMSRLFNGRPFRTNFDYYGELQEPAIRFGKTLKGVSKNTNETLKSLGRAAIDNRFTTKVENEYRANDDLTGLFALIHSMGVMKEAAYEAFGMGTGEALPRSKKALELFESLTEQSQNTTNKSKRFQKID